MKKIVFIGHVRDLFSFILNKNCTSYFYRYCIQLLHSRVRSHLRIGI